MRKALLILIPLLFAILLFLAVQFYLSRNAGKGALQVTATPQATVYLNGKSIGKTPLCKCEVQDMLAVGDYTLRVVPIQTELPALQEKITIGKSVLTVVDRTFGQGTTSEGSIITLSPNDDKKAASLLLVSTPDKVAVTIDNSDVGTTPLLLKNVTESDHEIKVTKSGYREKTVRIRTIKGYKLTASITLGIDVNDIIATPTPTASPSATPSLTNKVTILQTPTGFLRVRASASTSGAEIGRLSPGEIVDFVSEDEGWYEIKLSTGKTGWISAQYAAKN